MTFETALEKVGAPMVSDELQTGVGRERVAESWLSASNIGFGKLMSVEKTWLLAALDNLGPCTEKVCSGYPRTLGPVASNSGGYLDQERPGTESYLTG